MNYYNEINPHAATWLQNLMDAGAIAKGVIDVRSIEDVVPNDLAGFTQCHFFAGIGGWAYALDLAGWPRDKPVWTGSCPCQPFSAVGKGAGLDDERHLWPAWQHLIAQCKPSTIFGEQVTGAIRKGWLDGVISDLEGCGYACGAAVLQASGADAPHKRDRLWFVADTERDKQSWEEPCIWEAGRVGREQQPVSWNRGWQDALRAFRAMDDGLQRNVGGTDAARNAIVPQIAAEFIAAAMASQWG